MQRPSQTIQDAEAEVEAAVYQAAAPILERLEHDGLIVGNGHHAAQKIAEFAKGQVTMRWKASTRSPQAT